MSANRREQGFVSGPVRRILLATLAVSLAAGPLALRAERRGAILRLDLLDGKQLQGELLALKGETLILLSTAGSEVRASIRDVARAGIQRKNRVGKGLVRGLLWGGLIVGGLLGIPLAIADDEWGKTNVLVAFTLLGAVPGAAIGTIAGLSTGPFRSHAPAENGDEWRAAMLKRLRPLARFRAEEAPGPVGVAIKAVAAPAAPSAAKRKNRFSRLHMEVTFLRWLPSVKGNASEFVRGFRYDDRMKPDGVWGTWGSSGEGENLIRGYELRLDCSIHRHWAIGILLTRFPSRTDSGSKDLRLAGEKAQYLDWAVSRRSRSCFLVLSYFPLAAGGSPRKNTFRLQAGVGKSWSSASYFEYGYFESINSDYSYHADLGPVDSSPLSVLISAGALHFFNRTLSLALDAGYRFARSRFREREIVAPATMISPYLPEKITFTIPEFDLKVRSLQIGVSLGLHF